MAEVSQSNYFKERNRKNLQKIKALMADLPVFCYEFFIGIENRTTPLTRLNYAYDLRIFFDFLTKEIDDFYGKKVKDFTIEDLDSLTQTHVEIYLNYLNDYTFDGKEYSNDERGKSRKLASLRTFLKYFFNKDKLKGNVATKVAMPKLHGKSIIRLEGDEVSSIIDLAESGKLSTKQQEAFHKHTKVRDYAILSLLLGTGIRVSECVGLNVTDVFFSNNSFKITRKGGEEVILYFNEEVEYALKQYIAQRNQIKGIDEEKALFLSLQKKRIGVRAVEKLVKKYASVVTPLKKITPHKLRSTYGTNLYQQTRDIYIVADVLGHKDINTTKKHYAAQVDDNRKNAATKIKLR